MPEIVANGWRHFYEQRGQGPDLVFVHGAFVDSDLWEPQFESLADRYRVLRYDLRGHGRTGPSDLDAYTIHGYGQDLAALTDALGLRRFSLCGLSLGGMIAQDYAVNHPERLKTLVLAGTAVSVSLTLSDKLQRYVLFPKWAMQLTIRSLNVRNFIRFSFWLARWTRSQAWFGQDETTRNYVERCMLAMDDREYLKIYDAIYAFDLLPLERIRCPTLVLNGEHESRAVFRHTEEVLRRVPQAEARVVSQAGHTSNMENPAVFNRLLDDFLSGALHPDRPPLT